LIDINVWLAITWATAGQRCNGAFEIYHRWHQDPTVELVGEPRAAEVLLREAATPFLQQAGTRVIADCYLAGFAEAVGGAPRNI
jgi:hypothetical protein